MLPDVEDTSVLNWLLSRSTLHDLISLIMTALFRSPGRGLRRTTSISSSMRKWWNCTKVSSRAPWIHTLKGWGRWALLSWHALWKHIVFHSRARPQHAVTAWWTVAISRPPSLRVWSIRCFLVLGGLNQKYLGKHCVLRGCNGADEVPWTALNSRAADCEVSHWASWNSCSATGEDGWKTRSRRIVRDATYDGAACTNVLMDVVICSGTCVIGSRQVWGGYYSMVLLRVSPYEELGPIRVQLPYFREARLSHISISCNTLRLKTRASPASLQFGLYVLFSGTVTVTVAILAGNFCQQLSMLRSPSAARSDVSYNGSSTFRFRCGSGHLVSSLLEKGGLFQDVDARASLSSTVIETRWRLDAEHWNDGPVAPGQFLSQCSGITVLLHRAAQWKEISTPLWSRYTTKGADPRNEHWETNCLWVLLVSRFGCFRVSVLLVVGPSCLCSVFCLVVAVLLSCEFIPRFFSLVTGAVPRTGKVFQASPWQLRQVSWWSPTGTFLGLLQHAEPFANFFKVFGITKHVVFNIIREILLVDEAEVSFEEDFQGVPLESEVVASLFSDTSEFKALAFVPLSSEFGECYISPAFATSGLSCGTVTTGSVVSSQEVAPLGVILESRDCVLPKLPFHLQVKLQNCPMEWVFWLLIRAFLSDLMLMIPGLPYCLRQSDLVDRREVIVHCSLLVLSTTSATNPGLRYDLMWDYSNTTCSKAYNGITNVKTPLRFFKVSRGLIRTTDAQNFSYRLKVIELVDLTTRYRCLSVHWV